LNDPGSLLTLPGLSVDRVIVALEDRRSQLDMRPLLRLKLAGVTFDYDTTFLERAAEQLDVPRILPSEIVFGSGFSGSRLRWYVKRLLDILLSTFLLILGAPLLLLTACLIKWDSPGPALYRQTRIGQDGAPFAMLKFRSMVIDAEPDGQAVWACRHDPRVTRVGAVIRVLRIDELPQLLNVLRGEMSFVGPRPERPYFVAGLSKTIPFYALRSHVRPGVTGLAQVRYPYGASEEDALQKLKYDLYYLKHASPWLDLKIVVSTVRVVCTGFGAR
jgi:exopolysaccharide biosynthesis polyprenyl glycosylphosphotransferase